MTDVTVEGGLDEPAELEPEQGSLALASPEDTHGRADWESAAAAVLRKARRLTDEDDDSLVWQKLTRPPSTASASRRWAPRTCSTACRPRGARPAAATGTSAPTSGSWTRRSAHEEAMTDLENGVTSLWLRLEPDADLDTLLDGVFLDLAPVVLDAPDDPMAAAMALLTRAEDIELHPATNLGIPAEKVTAAAAGLAYGNGVLGFVVDATTVHDRGASDVQELAYSMQVAATYLRSLTGDRRHARRRGRAGRVPVRRHRRAVPDHRQAPRRPPAVGAGARAQRLDGSRPTAAPSSASTWSPAGR